MRDFRLITSQPAQQQQAAITLRLAEPARRAQTPWCHAGRAGRPAGQHGLPAERRAARARSPGLAGRHRGVPPPSRPAVCGCQQQGPQDEPGPGSPEQLPQLIALPALQGDAQPELYCWQLCLLKASRQRRQDACLGNAGHGCGGKCAGPLEPPQACCQLLGRDTEQTWCCMHACAGPCSR